jgi:lysophospholipase L1-like esterase
MIKFLKNNIKLLLVSVLIAVITLFCADLYLHQKLDQSYNYKGYRGEIKDDKKEDELRIACFGGSTTFGYGVQSHETWPFYLEQYLGGNTSVINLGMNSQGILGITADIKNYENLHYDIALIYDGYNDRNPLEFNTYSPREEDFIFRNFGYKVILPLYLREKFEILFNDDEKVTFNGNASLPSKTNTQKYFFEQDSIADALGKKGKIVFSDYLNSLKNALTELTNQDKKVLCICQPESYNTTQQRETREFIKKNFPEVIYLNCSNSVNMSTFAYDGLHLNAAGNKTLAKAIGDSLRNYKVIER